MPTAFVLESAMLSSDLEFVLRIVTVDGFLRIKAGEMMTDDFLRFVTLDLFRAGVPARNLAIRVEHEDGVVLNAFNHEADLFLAALELLLQLRTHRNIVLQRLIRLFQRLRSLGHPSRKPVACLTERFRCPAALVDHGA